MGGRVAVRRLPPRDTGAGLASVTTLLALSGVPPGEAFIFSAASALVWAPVFGFVAWAVDGMHEAGFSIGQDGLVHAAGSAWASDPRT